MYSGGGSANKPFCHQRAHPEACVLRLSCLGSGYAHLLVHKVGSSSPRLCTCDADMGGWWYRTLLTKVLLAYAFGRLLLSSAELRSMVRQPETTPQHPGGKQLAVSDGHEY